MCCCDGAGIVAQEGHEGCVLALLQHGADPAHSDRCGRNAFRVAAKSGHDAVLRLLQLHQQQPNVSVKPSAPEMSGQFFESIDNRCMGYYEDIRSEWRSEKSGQLPSVSLIN